MAEPVTLIIFERDLRLSDHPALSAAADRGAVVPVYLRDPVTGEPSAADVWLHHALLDFDQQLRERGSRLIVRRPDELPALVKQTGASAVYWTRRYDPAGRADDAARLKSLRDMNVEARHLPGALLFEPGEVMTAAGGPYRVFTPFHQQCMKRHVDGPQGEVTLRSPKQWPPSMKLDALRLLSDHPWADRVMSHWQVGEAAAQAQSQRFIDESVGEYDRRRDRLDEPDAVSRLSPYLSFGHISVRQVWNAVMAARSRPRKQRQAGCDAFLRQLIWREFAYQLLWHYPRMIDQPLDGRFVKLRWVRDAKALDRWQRGRTGYPIVDAAMHELWQTGYMHNRTRMIVASFLTKDLRINWRTGAAWFMRTLVDADVANNTFGWQWVAGCGADAQPYFRVFNPALQAKKFDPRKGYIEQWNGETGDEPMVDHAAARDAALSAYQQIKRAP